MDDDTYITNKLMVYAMITFVFVGLIGLKSIDFKIWESKSEESNIDTSMYSITLELREHETKERVKGYMNLSVYAYDDDNSILYIGINESYTFGNAFLYFYMEWQDSNGVGLRLQLGYNYLLYFQTEFYNSLFLSVNENTELRQTIYLVRSDAK